ncbi:putative leucine-rich repeat-containing protein DDB_G0290503 isoform X2 [Takifugu flavidus]|uniref:putative leucine-rich repeat-containing protein DDB_G0290503 isoform X2 n=1 Tax=Takifugu flavidus TaxID=433684 RepID=UPI0025444C11|nr:putative leucine-rich repeat-containing protein DDB_G0290503 isoform X2 [Takifugu flavidus]
MASVSYTVWVPLLLTFVSPASGQGQGKYVLKSPRKFAGVDISSTGALILPPGLNSKNINVTTVVVKPCKRLEELVAELTRELADTTDLYNQMENEASGLKSEVNRLKTQVATCDLSVYQSQLQRKLSHILETFDSEAFWVLKTASLTRDVMRLQQQIKRAANSTDASRDEAMIVLQKELQEKNRQLSVLQQQFQGSRGDDYVKINQIILLLNQIWNLDLLDKETPQKQSAFIAKQTQLDKLISELQRKDATSAMLALLSVQDQITRAQRTTKVVVEESKTNYAIYQRQWSQKVELLKKKVVELSRDVNNTEITMEILKLQSEVENIKLLIVKEKRTTETLTTEMKVSLETLKKQQMVLQKQLEEVDYVQAQMILKIFNIMKEIREQEADEPEYKPSKFTNLETLLQAKEKELTNAQTELKELKRKLQSVGQSCYLHTQSEFEQQVAALASAGESDTALILSAIKLQDEIKILEELIKRTTDKDKLSDLKNQLEAKQEKMFSKITNIERIPKTNPTKILEIVNLYSELWSLQRQPANGTTIEQVRAKQVRLDDLLGGITGNENMKATLRVSSLQNQVDYLQNSLLDLQTSQTAQVSQLKEDLAAKKMELQQYVKDLTDKNETNAKLILKVTDLYNQLRNLERERNSDRSASSMSITQLREQLKDAMEAQSSAEAQVKALQRQLQEQEIKCARIQEEVQELQRRLSSQSERCLNPEEKYNQAKTGLEDMIAKLNANGNARAAKVFSVLLNRTQENQGGAESGDIGEDDFQEMLNIILVEVDDGEATKLLMNIIKLQNQLRQLQRWAASDLPADQKTAITNELAAKNSELQQTIDELEEMNHSSASLIVAATDVYNRLRYARTEQQKDRAEVAELKEQLGRREAQHERDQAEIDRLQEQLNATVAKCSGVEAAVKGLQEDLEVKMKELQSKSDTVTSLALQVSTLTLQVTNLNSQLQQAAPGAKVKELQMIINEKNAELANKTEELSERSAQSQRILMIIQLQAEIEKYSKTAKNDMDFKKIQGLQERLKDLIDGIEETDDVNTKLTFILLAQRDEIAKLKIQEDRQTRENLEKIKDLENKVEDFKQQIQDKTQMIDSSNLRASELSAEIMALHKGINAMKDDISKLREENANIVKNLQSRLESSKKKLKDTSLLLQQTDAKNFDLIMEIVEVKDKLKKAQEDSLKSSTRTKNELEEVIETNQREMRRLETANNDLNQLVQELRTCCSDSPNQCEELERDLLQCRKDSEHLLQQMSAKDQKIEELTQQLQEQINQVDKVTEENALLQNERERLESIVEDLQERLSEKEDSVIRARRITMDPDTANPRVGLSAGNTQLYMMAVPQDVQDLPGRFDVVLASLGNTGYSSGRQYWEVSVGDRLCYHLGFASESAQRKGILKFSPATGYWTLILNKQGQFRALDRSPAVVKVQTPPVTLGILLDYKKGQISFYDTGARAHLYSFSGQTFTDKLYPFFNFCNDDLDNQTPIELLPPGPTNWLQ